MGKKQAKAKGLPAQHIYQPTVFPFDYLHLSPSVVSPVCSGPPLNWISKPIGQK